MLSVITHTDQFQLTFNSDIENASVQRCNIHVSLFLENKRKIYFTASMNQILTFSLLGLKIIAEEVA